MSNNNEVPLEYQILPKALTPADQADLAKYQAEYVAKMQNCMPLRKVTTKRKLDARGLLECGEDPFLVAIYLRLPFTPVAEIANKILEERGYAQRIPTDGEQYLKLCAVLAYNKEQAAKATAEKLLKTELKNLSPFPKEAPKVL